MFTKQIIGKIGLLGSLKIGHCKFFACTCVHLVGSWSSCPTPLVPDQNQPTSRCVFCYCLIDLGQLLHLTCLERPGRTACLPSRCGSTVISGNDA